ncbi:MAG: alkaline phosphatase family protein [Candidatus Bathyarchaeota archaeon]|nr:alkaline phosphatase family protein [Candidatus Bathyarchaeota archaeon]
MVSPPNPTRTTTTNAGQQMLTKQIQTHKDPQNNFIYPQYKQNNITNIPNTIQHLLLKNKQPKNPLQKKVEPLVSKETNKIVLLVIDGFGFNQFLKHHQQNPFLSNLSDKGEVTPITSVFPTQTTNALTSLNTGLTPQEHGLFEYFIYLKGIGVVNALRFERLGNKRHSKPEDEGHDPSVMLLKGKTIHSTLKEEGIPSWTHMNFSNATNAASKLIFQDSTVIPAVKASDCIVQLRKNLQETKGSGYFFIHLDTIDTVSHEYGPDSEEYNAELSALTYLLHTELVQKLDAQTAKETLLILTADHGGVNVDPQETTYLPRAPLNFYVEKHRPIPPTGSPREIFLHIKEEKLNQTKQWLQQAIGKKAQILQTKEVAARGLFGDGQASEDFFERTGNLMIIPYENGTVWFESRMGRRIPFLGQHGGLSEDEILVPFGAAMLDRLKV